MNGNLSCILKIVVYIIKCTKCKEICSVCSETLNNRVSLYKNNIKFPENRKLLHKNAFMNAATETLK